MSLAGLVYEMLGKVPIVADRVDLPGCVLEVASMESQRVAQIKLTYRKRASRVSDDKKNPTYDKDLGPCMER